MSLPPSGAAQAVILGLRLAPARGGFIAGPSGLRLIVTFHRRSAPSQPFVARCRAAPGYAIYPHLK